VAAQRRPASRPQTGKDGLLRKSLAGERQEFSETLRKVLRLEHVGGAAQGRGRDGVGARGAAYAEVDALRMQCLQYAEGLGHLERGVVGEHDPPCADPDLLCHARDVPDHDLRRGAGDARQVVMLGQPVPLVAEPVGEPSKLGRVAERLGSVRARADRRDVQDGEPKIHVVQLLHKVVFQSCASPIILTSLALHSTNFSEMSGKLSLTPQVSRLYLRCQLNLEVTTKC
jgi:hypothetical protein